MQKRPSAQPTVQVDNAFSRVTEWHFPPGSETGWHAHEMDYVVVPMTTGVLHIEHPNGEVTESQLTMGQSYARKTGVEHNVINPGPDPFTFVEIEIKSS